MPETTFIYNRPSDNLIATLSPTITVETGTADSDYGVDNLGDFSDEGIGQPLLLEETEGAVLIDWGVATAVPLFVLWTNADEGLALRIQGNATNSWGSPSLDYELTAPAKRRNGYTVKLWADLRAVAGYGAYRYTRIVLGDLSVSPVIGNSVPVGLKVWAGGAIRTLGRDFEFSPSILRHQMQTAAHTDTGYGWFSKLQGFVRGLQYSLFLDETTNEHEDFLGWFDEAGSDPVVLIPDPSVNDAWIGRWSGSPSPMSDDGLMALSLAGVIAPEFAIGWRRYTGAFVEVTAGGPEWI